MTQLPGVGRLKRMKLNPFQNQLPEARIPIFGIDTSLGSSPGCRLRTVQLFLHPVVVVNVEDAPCLREQPKEGNTPETRQRTAQIDGYEK